ncbi:DUF1642 domain-containing protein [Paenibacillus sp. sgz302251]|uniref:DUF1642 domain-containing protein n=1 Tax=Paenibacillus sp. sgz302251 TaxID=3414493 RepID=UPI003C7CDB98
MGRMKDRDFQTIKINSKPYGAKAHIDVVRDLISHAEAIELELKISKEDEVEAVRKYGEAMQNIDRLINNVEQLKRELTEAREPKKVVLPKEVAEAIDECRRQDEKWSMGTGRNFSLLDNVNQAIRVRHGSKFINTIAAWIVDDRKRRDVLLQALVNGYTVEQTKEDRLREGIEGLVKEWSQKPQHSAYITANLTQAVFNFVTKFNAEN